MIYYISIPMKGLDPIKQRRKAFMWQILLEKEGHRVINPFILGDKLKQFHSDTKRKEPTEAEYLANDISELKSAQAIFFCDGWTNSFGCMEECDEAIRLKLKVRFERHE